MNAITGPCFKNPPWIIRSQADSSACFTCSHLALTCVSTCVSSDLLQSDLSPACRSVCKQTRTFLLVKTECLVVCVYLLEVAMRLANGREEFSGQLKKNNTHLTKMLVAFVVNPHRLSEISPTLQTEPAHTHWETVQGTRKRRKKRVSSGFCFRPDSHRTFEGIFTQSYIVRTIQHQFIGLPWDNSPNRIIKWNQELKCHRLLAMVGTLLQSPDCVEVVSCL